MRIFSGVVREGNTVTKLQWEAGPKETVDDGIKTLVAHHAKIHGKVEDGAKLKIKVGIKTVDEPGDDD